MKYILDKIIFYLEILNIYTGCRFIISLCCYLRVGTIIYIRTFKIFLKKKKNKNSINNKNRNKM